MSVSISVSDSIGRLLTNASSSIAGVGNNVFECLINFVAQNPAIKPYIFDESGQLTSFIHVYLNGVDIRGLKKDELVVKPSDKIEIIPSLAGG